MYSRLFELIRREEVVLFVGAGFSINAGYPSGAGLCKLLYDSLTNNEKKEINEHHQLPELTEEFVQIRGNSKNSLITILKEIYGKTPVDLSYHQKIKSIPHFTNIITTNYDSLFETVYKDSCNILFKDEHCTYIDKSKINIFKIHGDLSDPNSIIITKSDYTHFFDTQKEIVFWNKIKDIIATCNVLFIGYGFEDENIVSIISKIKEAVGNNHKEMFLIGPDWKGHKIERLTSYGVRYFNDNGGNFLDQLTKNIKKNIREDFEDKKVSSEVFSKFCSINKLSIDLNISEQKNAVVKIKSIDNTPLKSKITFSVTEEYSKRIINRELDQNNNLPIKINGENIGLYPSIDIPFESLVDFEYSANEIVFSKKSDIRKLMFVQVPSKKGTITIQTPENIVYGELKYQLFVKNNVESTFKVTTPLYYLTVDLKYESEDKFIVNGYPTFKDFYSNNAMAIYWTNLLIKIYQGGIFTFIIDNKDVVYDIPTFENKDEVIRLFQEQINYYNNISEIEKIIHKKFEVYNKFTDDNKTLAMIILSYLKKEFELIPAKGFVTNFGIIGDNEIVELINKNPESRFFLFQTSELQVPMILNKYQFKIKYKNIIYSQCKIIEFKVTEDGNTNVEFMNEGEYIQVSYTENAIRQEGLEIKFFD